MGGTMDVLDGGAGADRPPRPWRGLAAVVVIALLAAGLWWADDRDRRESYDALLSCVATAESRLTHIRNRITATADYIRPAIRYDLAPEVREGILGIVEDTAAAELESARAVRPACERVDPRPWQRSLQDARDAYLAYLDARVDLFVAISLSARRTWAERNDLEPLRDRARATLLAAAPPGTAAAAEAIA